MKLNVLLRTIQRLEGFTSEATFAYEPRPDETVSVFAHRILRDAMPGAVIEIRLVEYDDRIMPDNDQTDADELDADLPF